MGWSDADPNRLVNFFTGKKDIKPVKKKVKCDCGGTIAKTTHSSWCSTSQVKEKNEGIKNEQT